MHSFLSNNRDELIARCKVKVAQRPRRTATPAQLAHGVPMFLDQLTRTLRAEEADPDQDQESLRMSGASGADALALSEMGVSAAAHGTELLKLGFSVDQVVHDYGDLGQAITDLALERDAPFAVGEFRTLNHCLDNAIADAVTEFSAQRDANMARQQSDEARERIGFLVHELHNALGTATLAVSALELGRMPLSGASGAVLKRSLAALERLIGRSLSELGNGTQAQRHTFSLAGLIAEAGVAAELQAGAAGCPFRVSEVNPALGVHANREQLLAALGNLLQNAFKFTRSQTEVTLVAVAFGAHVLIEVSDHCGGLPPRSAEAMFAPFTQSSDDTSGLGLGLSIARQSVEADAGTLTVRDHPGTGCVFTICLPRHAFVPQP